MAPMLEGLKMAWADPLGRAKIIKLAFGGALGFASMAILWVAVSFWAALGVFLALWGNNIQITTKV